MKLIKGLGLLICCALYLSVNAQCTIEPFSLQKRIYLSDLVVEGKVLSQRSVWNESTDMIYTLNEIEVYKLFEGTLNQSKVLMVTYGGQVGHDMIKVEPSLELEKDQMGIFLMKNIPELKAEIDEEFPVSSQVYFPSANVQSFLKYDDITLEVHSYFENYSGPVAAYTKIESYTDKEFKNIEDIDLNKGIKPIAAPSITSLSHDTISAGTESVLTITGSNFGIVKGKGKVEFVDANYGDGRFFEPRWETSYKSWSNSKIEVYVPSRAGTGKIRVTNNGNESGTASTSLVVKYAHLNASFYNATTDSAYFMIDHINDNGFGGYSWYMNHKFRAKTDAVNSFMRSLENWRCGTLMNWDVGADTATDAQARDGINLVRFTKFSDSKLGVCYSYWSGCQRSGNWNWYLNEMDIEFDSSRNWYYGTGTPGNSQYDFESVATHELGHGHQLGHVIDQNKIMHYSIRNGSRKVVLSDFDIEAGEYVRDKSKVSNPCGPNRIVPLVVTACNITKPKANFTLSSTTICPGEDLVITDASEGTVKTYAWTFGSGASIANATTKGPHTISYSTEGTKTIFLIVSNDFGNSMISLNVTVEPAAPEAPMAFMYDDTVCNFANVRVNYTIAGTARATSYMWTLANGGNIDGVSTDTTVDVIWTNAGGPYPLEVKAVNSCGESDSVVGMISVLDTASADFTTNIVGRDVSFTFTGSSADTYEWQFGDGESSSEIDPAHTYPTASTYTAKLIVSNTCSSDTMEKNIETEFGVGIDEIEEIGLTVYPNPTQDLFTLENAGSSDLKVALYDINGKLIFTENVIAKSKKLMNLNSLNKGIYTLECNADGKRYAKRVVLY